VSRQGENLPGFMARQLEFAAHIRNPQQNPRPGDVPERRMQIYLELFYNNIEGFLSSTFPIAKQVLESVRWHALVREFIHRHPSQSPYFLEISQEFLTFLGEAFAAPATDLPAFLLELCHYEWVELCLSVAEEDLPEQGVDRDGDLLVGVPVVSPLIWKLAYRYPVHEIGPSHQPQAPAEQPTQLVVYRRRDDLVKFMVVNSLTLALLDELDGEAAGAAALQRLGARLPHLPPRSIDEKGLATLERLRKAEVILGTKTESGDQV
jgi:uncharacterized protein